ncbi:lariat debranching enzyme [Thoreauomyces humboldtii]|nr:lariat debranching enzyme [Thoreauomyces humboldtii]
MRIAIEGCCHGELDRIYASLKNIQTVENITIDLLLICGDFQSIRNYADLGVLACPEKYRAIGNFYEYYAGAKVAPIPTIFIGGNHEASSYLWELFHGGWVAPNIYFLGHAGVVNFGGLRISGLSGIYKKPDYDSGYYEKQPYNDSDQRSIYHVRKYNVFRLAQIREPLDIMLSHDWPRGIATHGNTRQLLQVKPFLAGEIKTNTLGNYPAEYLLKHLKPAYWFAAHLHVKFAAVYNHDLEEVGQHDLKPKPAGTTPASAPPPALGNPDEINLADDDAEEDDVNAEASAPVAASGDGAPGETSKGAEGTEATELMEIVIDTTGASKTKATLTKFLALDKCLPNRDFLQVLEFPDTEGASMALSYDEEWLAIVRATNDLLSLTKVQAKVPADDEIKTRIDAERAWIKEHVSSRENGLLIPQNFSMTAPAYVAPPPGTRSSRPPSFRPGPAYLSPQMTEFCALIGIPNFINQKGLAPGTVPSISKMKKESAAKAVALEGSTAEETGASRSPKRLKLELPQPKADEVVSAPSVPGEEFPLSEANAEEPAEHNGQDLEGDEQVKQEHLLEQMEEAEDDLGHDGRSSWAPEDEEAHEGGEHDEGNCAAEEDHGDQGHAEGGEVFYEDEAGFTVDTKGDPEAAEEGGEEESENYE